MYETCRDTVAVTNRANKTTLEPTINGPREIQDEDFRRVLLLHACGWSHRQDEGVLEGRVVPDQHVVIHFSRDNAAQ